MPQPAALADTEVLQQQLRELGRLRSASTTEERKQSSPSSRGSAHTADVTQMSQLPFSHPVVQVIAPVQ